MNNLEAKIQKKILEREDKDLELITVEKVSKISLVVLTTITVLIFLYFNFKK